MKYRTAGVGVALLLCGIAVAANPRVLLRFPLAERLLTRWIPPEVTEPSASSTAPERDAFRALGRQVRGRLLWASNRAGNHDIYEADLATGRVRRLTTHPHVDYFPRYSPDGRSISFLRTLRPWASFREAGVSDLFVMNADGGGERRVAQRVDHATWTPDGSGLVFVRVDENRIVRLDLASGREVVLYEGSAPATEGMVNDPTLGEHNLLALTLRGVPRKRRGVGVVDLTKGRYQSLSNNPRACQVSWTPGDTMLVWVEGSMLGGTRVMRGGADGAAAKVLIDLPGRSYEYFPRVSPDRRWLVWGASAGGHEQDRADYEVFAWRIGAPWESAIRLTYSPANDEWPDLFPD